MRESRTLPGCLILEICICFLAKLEFPMDIVYLDMNYDPHNSMLPYHETIEC